MENDCIFCKIVDKKIPADIIYEDKDTLAFLDISPVNIGHTLVIPKKHFRNVFDIPKEEYKKVMETVWKITPKIKEAVKAGGVNIGNSNEKIANQAVFHLHIHIMPRFENDGLKMFPSKKYKEGEAKDIAEKIKSLF